MANIFFDIGIILIIATIFAFIAKSLKQPLIPAYILTGLIIGPLLGLITNTDIIITLSEIGIAFLLFIVGLEINIKRLSDVGPIATIGGLTQILIIFTVSFLIVILLGFIQIEAIYLALIIAFSSTMIVVKLLSDKREMDTLHGRIIIGFLLMQDIVAIFVLSILTTLSEFTLLTLFYSIIKGIFVFIIAAFAGKYLFPPIFSFAAKSQELLFIAAISVSFLFSILFNSNSNIIIII
ncbi:MAG: cation:proton antiporter [Bacteroidetes bacterium]|nr:cation:proton antiporter [Bacteroidota bacterium]